MEEENGMTTSTYASPVDKLLTLRSYKPGDALEWPDYQALGIGLQDIPELIRMATDKTLRQDLLDVEELDEAQELAFWAPLHAMLILGELQAEEAIEPLLALFDHTDQTYDEWVLEELPAVFSKIGPAALPAIGRYLSDPLHTDDSRNFASNTVPAIVDAYPEARAEGVAALSSALENFATNDYELNGGLVANLVHLKAVESAPLIERAFAANRVDEFYIGDWDDVQVELELKEPSEKQIRDESRLRDLIESLTRPVVADETPRSDYPIPAPVHTYAAVKPAKSSTARKNKRKIAKAARKKNKRKK
jgi:hypothetical protein